jgi:hypothetical protein
VALSLATQEVVWLKRLLSDIGVSLDGPTTLMEDNQGAIAITKNPIAHARTKHIDIRYHYIRKAVNEGTIIEVGYCPTKQMIADVLTKPLPRGQSENLRLPMGLRSQ